MKGLPMDAKIKKMLLKGALGLVGSAVIGYLIKLEKTVEERIDEHYDSSASNSTEN